MEQKSKGEVCDITSALRNFACINSGCKAYSRTHIVHSCSRHPVKEAKTDCALCGKEMSTQD